MAQIYALKTTAKREDQVVDFVESNVKKKNLLVYSLISAYGMSGYVFVEAESMDDARQAFAGVPYAKGLLPKPVQYSEIAPMIEQINAPMNIQEKDIVEIIQGPFKRQKAKVKRVDEQKEEVIVEILEAAIPIPITIKMDWVKVIRRDSEDESGGGRE